MLLRSSELTRAYVGLGSNLGDPADHVRTALHELAGLPATTRVGHSRLYRSPPMGPAGQPDYVNAVAMLDTALEPLDLLLGLQALEARHGRARGAVRWGPRTLDLDLLIFGERRSADPGLTLPHPGIADRPFVLWPLLEVAPDLQVPGLGAVRDLVRGMAPLPLEGAGP